MLPQQRDCLFSVPKKLRGAGAVKHSIPQPVYAQALWAITQPDILASPESFLTIIAPGGQPLN
jgi:hypothetical protein